MDGSHLLRGNRATREFIRNILLSIAQLEENAEADHSSLKTFEDLISFDQLYNWPNVRAQQRQPSRVCLPFSSFFTLNDRAVKVLAFTIF